MTKPDLKIVSFPKKDTLLSIFAGRCWLLHRWKKWVLINESASAYSFKSATIGVEKFQRRECERCGKMQMRLL